MNLAGSGMTTTGSKQQKVRAPQITFGMNWKRVLPLKKRAICLLSTSAVLTFIIYGYGTIFIFEEKVLINNQEMHSQENIITIKEPQRTHIASLNMSLIKHRFSERLRLLQHQCRERSSWNDQRIGNSPNDVSSSCDVLEGYKVLYCHVFKSGLSSMCNLLVRLYNHEEILRSGKMYKILAVLRPTKERFHEAMRSKDFLRFLVAREPLSRLVSGYRNRIQYTKGYSFQLAHWGPLILKYTRGLRDSEVRYPNKTLKIVPTFKEFSQFLASQNPRDFDAHWLPFGFQCGVCEFNYTNIVHLETFEEDIKYITRITGIDHVVDLTKINLRENVGIGNTTEILIEYYSTLDPETLQKIIDIYRDDFKLFGYDPRPLLRIISPNVTIKF